MLCKARRREEKQLQLFILMSTNSQDIFSWSLKSLGTWETELAMFSCILTLLTSRHPKSNDLFSQGFYSCLRLLTVFLKWCANCGLRALSQGSDSGGSGSFSSCPAPLCKTKAQRELQLLPKNRCGFFFPVQTILVWACTIPISFLADSLPM